MVDYTISLRRFQRKEFIFHLKAQQMEEVPFRHFPEWDLSCKIEKRNQQQGKCSNATMKLYNNYATMHLWNYTSKQRCNHAIIYYDMELCNYAIILYDMQLCDYAIIYYDMQLCNHFVWYATMRLCNHLLWYATIKLYNNLIMQPIIQSFNYSTIQLIHSEIFL